MKNLIYLFTCVLALCACTSKKEAPVVPPDDHLYLLVGCYSDGTTAGIGVYDFDTQNADIQLVSEKKEVLDPNYLAISTDEKFVYSTSETGDKSSASAFTFDKSTGVLSLLNQHYTEGQHPCYISINKGKTFAVTANWSGGSISVFPIAEDGSLKPVSQVFDMNKLDVSDAPVAHLHSVVLSPDEKYLFAADMGHDKIYKFNVDVNASDTFLIQDVEGTTALEAGAGPRHLIFHPNEKYLYCLNELSGFITVFDYSDGHLNALQSIASDTTPGIGGKGSADIHLSPDCRFLYSSNRLKNDGIAIFSVNPEDGLLTKVAYQETGIHPRGFILSPDGRFLLCANRDSNNVQIFSRDEETGLLTNTGKEILIGSPVTLKWIAKK
jgi:6-phosphogluconolactonase (cycloisomerase 2 family)